MTGLSVSSSGSSGAFANAEPVAAASLTAPSASAGCRTPDGGTCAPRLTASAVAVPASITCSSATTAGHQAVARLLIDGGSDMVRWNSARRSARAR